MANKIHDAFENVTADSRLKESTREYLALRRRKKGSFSLQPPIYRILAAACMLTILLCGAGGYAGYTWLFSPVSYVSIDVNPSVELALNRLDRVVFVSAFNPQGEELLENLSLRGKKYTTAIDIIAASKVLRKYLDLDEELVLTIAADSSREEALKEGVETSCRHIGHGSRSVIVGLDIVSEAHGHGLSVGKYSAYLKLSQYDDNITVEECRDMSMSEIHCRIIEHEHSSGHDENTTGQNPEENGKAHGEEDGGNGQAHENGSSGNEQAHETAGNGSEAADGTAGNGSGQAHETAGNGSEAADGTAGNGSGQADGTAGSASGEADAENREETQDHGHQHRRNHGNHE